MPKKKAASSLYKDAKSDSIAVQYKQRKKKFTQREKEMNISLSSFLIHIITVFAIQEACHGEPLRQDYYRQCCPYVEDIRHCQGGHLEICCTGFDFGGHITEATLSWLFC